MSGTSLDGVDAVLADFSHSPAPVLAHYFSALPLSLSATLRGFNHPGDNELARAAVAANELVQHYAAAAQGVLALANVAANQVRALACHGQTVRHCPAQGYTLQLNNPALLAELTGIDVVADLRNADVAAGGQGAPLVPAFHAAVFASASQHRVILNLGGIANLSDLPMTGDVTGFDTGPANILMDAWYAQHHAGAYDANGAWAASGKIIPDLLAALLATPYFHLAPPKSTGRELFNAAWLKTFLQPGYAAADVQATLLELTAQSATKAIAQYCAGASELYLCGGGAYNTSLCQRLQALCEPLHIRVSTTATLGLPPQQVEAMAFAWLAHRRLQNLPGNLPSVTGARHPCILGALYPAAG